MDAAGVAELLLHFDVRDTAVDGDADVALDAEDRPADGHGTGGRDWLPNLDPPLCCSGEGGADGERQRDLERAVHGVLPVWVGREMRLVGKLARRAGAPAFFAG